MAATFTASLDLAFRVNAGDGTLYPAFSLSPSLIPPTLNFTSGTAVGAVDLVAMLPQIKATGTTTLNLYDGSVLTPLGGAAAFRHVSAFTAYNAGTVSAVLGGNFMTANFGGTQTLGAGCYFSKGDTTTGGFAVASGTSNVFTVTVAGTNAGAVNLAFGGRAE